MKRDLATITLTEVQSDHYRLNETGSKPSSTVAETFLLICFGTIALSAIATFLTKEFHKKKISDCVNSKLTKIPCPNCQYFSKSSYLRCAVQPKLTMTNEATDCSDFSPTSKS